MNIVFSIAGIMCALIGMYSVYIELDYGLDWITLGAGFGIWAEVRIMSKKQETTEEYYTVILENPSEEGLGN